MNLMFWLRWTLRDLRSRWLQVLAIALIVALGTGIFGGMGSQRKWREASYDRNYAQLNMFDLHLTLTSDSYLEGDTLGAMLNDIDGVEAAEVRLVTPTLVDASNADRDILVRGRIIGVQPQAQINRFHLYSGWALLPEDNGQNVVVVDYLFARYYDLKEGDPIRISGDIALEFVGAAQTPEYFQIIPIDAGGFLGEATFAVLHMPLASLQKLTGREGLVNEALIALTPDADRAAAQAAIAERMAQAFPEVGFELTAQQEDPVYKSLYGDAKNDQTIWNSIGWLFLFGAAMAAFNLAGRIVESQRRQFGISMALGVPRRWIAFRPLLMGLQIAVLGTIFGLVMGYALSLYFSNFVQDITPMPYWADPFYPESYIRALILGILIPFAATLYPVWRAVRVPPIQAIKIGYHAAKGGGLAPLLQKVTLPGRSFAQMPFRNLLRAPWRTVMTLLGVGVAIILLVVMTGFLDTINASIAQAEEAYLYTNPQRLTVILDSFYPTDPAAADPAAQMFLDVERVPRLMNLTQADGTPLFEKSEPTIGLEAQITNGGQQLDIHLTLLPMEDSLWTPSLVEGELPDHRRGIVLSQKAAHDLGIEVGDTITLTHPRREGLISYRMVESEVIVLGIHNIPVRQPAFMNLHQADLMGITGFTNILVMKPAEGVSVEEARRVLFAQQGVASVQAISELPKAFEETVELLAGIIRIVQGVVLAMAFLIAFNSTSINVDERQREIATMFAFGLPLRIVTRMQVVENAVMGLLGTLVGVVVGYLLLRFYFVAQLDNLYPDIQFIVDIAPATLGAAAILGVLVVALTPLFSIRRMLGMDIPSTLRVME